MKSLLSKDGDDEAIGASADDPHGKDEDARQNELHFMRFFELTPMRVDEDAGMHSVAEASTCGVVEDVGTRLR